jgi:hypothetical protein
VPVASRHLNVSQNDIWRQQVFHGEPQSRDISPSLPGEKRAIFPKMGIFIYKTLQIAKVICNKGNY